MKMKQICCEVGLKLCYTNRQKIDLSEFKKSLLTNLSNEWLESSRKMSKLDVYCSIKTEFGVEKYLELNIPKYEKSLLSQLRYGVLPLRIETGRFVNEQELYVVLSVLPFGYDIWR